MPDNLTSTTEKKKVMGRPRRTPMPKWIRRVISAIIALFIIAVSSPDVIVRGRVHTGLFIYILCVSIVPFLLVCIFAGRSKTAEIVGWCIQLFMLVGVFTR